MPIISVISKQAINIPSLSRTVDYETELDNDLICQYPWSPMRFAHSYIKSDNFISTKLLVFDMDNGSMTLNECIATFKAYKCIIGTTRSHQIQKGSKGPCDRFRLILEFDSEITDSESYAYNYQYYIKTLFKPNTVDEQVKDTARFYFPCQTIVHSSTGCTVPVMTGNRGVVLKPQSVSQAGPKGKLTRISTAQLARVEPIQNWHMDTLKLMTDMKNKGWDIDEIRDRVSELGDMPWDSQDEKRLQSVFKNDKVFFKNNNVEDTGKFILEGDIAISIIDNSDTISINTATKVRTRFDRALLPFLLGKNWPVVLADKIHLSVFEYAPYINQIFFMDGPVSKYNTYEPPNWLKDSFYGTGEPPTKEDKVPPLVEEFLRHLVDNDEDSYQYLLDWSALAVKNRNYTILTLIGNQGVGKGTFTDLLANVVGKSNFGKGRGNIFKGRFNSQLGDKRLVLLDEVELKTDEEFNLFKDLVNDEIIIEAKGKDERQAKNYASFVLASNDSTGIRLPSDDRRFSLINLTEVKLINNPKLKDRITEIKESKELADAFAKYLLYRDITRNMQETFKSPSKHAEVVDATMTVWEDFLLNEFSYHNVGKRIPLNELQETIKLSVGHRNIVGRIKLEKFAKENKKYFRFLQNEKGRFIEILATPPYQNNTKIN